MGNCDERDDATATCGGRRSLQLATRGCVIDAPHVTLDPCPFSSASACHPPTAVPWAAAAAAVQAGRTAAAAAAAAWQSCCCCASCQTRKHHRCCHCRFSPSWQGPRGPPTPSRGTQSALPPRTCRSQPAPPPGSSRACAPQSWRSSSASVRRSAPQLSAARCHTRIAAQRNATQCSAYERPEQQPSNCKGVAPCCCAAQQRHFYRDARQAARASKLEISLSRSLKKSPKP